jgi:preprotein translocase subunit SecE
MDKAPAPAEASTDVGAETEDLEWPFWELVRTLLLVIVVVGTAGLIAVLV